MLEIEKAVVVMSPPLTLAIERPLVAKSKFWKSVSFMGI